jgi:hypothetical protein
VNEDRRLEVELLGILPLGLRREGPLLQVEQNGLVGERRRGDRPARVTADVNEAVTVAPLGTSPSSDASLQMTSVFR